MHSIGSDNAALGKRGTVWNGCVYISPSLWQGYKNFKEVYCLWTSMPKPDESGEKRNRIVMVATKFYPAPEKEEEKPDQPKQKAVSKKKKASK